jgi:hypothetical protein
VQGVLCDCRQDINLLAEEGRMRITLITLHSVHRSGWGLLQPSPPQQHCSRVLTVLSSCSMHSMPASANPSVQLTV